MSDHPTEPTPNRSAGDADALAINPVAALRALRKYWATALATTIAIALLATFNTLGQKKIYQAEGTIQFDPNPPRPLGKGIDDVVEMGAGDYWDNHEYYETQYKVITSMRVALAVVGQLGLNHDGAFLANLPPKATAPTANASEETAAMALRGRLAVEPIKGSRLALVKLEDADPQRAQRILSQVLDTYISQNLEDALSATNSSADWLRGQVDKLKNDLEQNEMALHDYKQKKNILSVAFDDQSNMLREEMKQLNDALTSVRTRKEELAARNAVLGKIPSDDPSKLPASELLQSSLLQDLRRTYLDALRDRDGLVGEGKGPRHPDVLAADARVEAARKGLLAEVKNIQGAVASDLAILNRQEQGLSGLFEKAKTQALDLNLLEIEYNRLRRSKGQYREALFARAGAEQGERPRADAAREQHPRPRSAVASGRADSAARLREHRARALRGALARHRRRRRTRAPGSQHQDARGPRARVRRHVPRPPPRDRGRIEASRPWSAPAATTKPTGRVARAHRPRAADQRHRRGVARRPHEPHVHGAR